MQASNVPLTSGMLISSNQNLARTVFGVARPVSCAYLLDLSVEGIAGSRTHRRLSVGRIPQPVLKPEKLLAYNVSIKDLMMAVQRSNNDVGGSVVEKSENEYMVRSRAYLHGLEDMAKIPVGMAKDGVPVMLSEVASLQIAGEERRGIGEWNGEGEAVGGVVVARFIGANAFEVIHNAKAQTRRVGERLTPGVTIKTAYDRSDLIARSLHTLRHTLLEEITIVALVCILFLLHGRSALVAIFVLPMSVLASLLTMHLLDISAE